MKKGAQSISLNAMAVHLEFTKTMKIKMLAGRDFQAADFVRMDTSQNYANYTQPYIINRTLAKELGWQPGEAIGKIVEKSARAPVVVTLQTASKP